MRKTDKNQKPKPDKLKPNRITIQPSLDEKQDAANILKKVKSQQRKTIMLPKGYSIDWENEKESIRQRKLKKELSL